MAEGMLDVGEFLDEDGDQEVAAEVPVEVQGIVLVGVAGMEHMLLVRRRDDLHVEAVQGGLQAGRQIVVEQHLVGGVLGDLS